MAFVPGRISFFQGERELDTITFDGLPEGGKTTVRHTIGCEWVVGAETLCDQEVSKKITKRTGLSVTHRQDLEATVSSSVGVDFIGKLDAAIRGKLGRSVTLTKEVVEEDHRPFKGKDCYLKRMNIYQLYSRLSVDCEWTEKRWVGEDKKGYWEKELLVWHPMYYPRVDEITRADEECGCGPPEGAQVERIDISGSGFRMSEPFIAMNRLLTFFTLGVLVKDGVVEPFDADQDPSLWPPLDEVERDWTIDRQEALEEQLEPFLMADLPLPPTVLPGYLRFLTGADEVDSVHLNFTVPSIADLAEPEMT